MPAQDLPKYLIVRLRSRPGAIQIHQELHSIVPSGTALTAEQQDFIYGERSVTVPSRFRPANRPERHARYITADRRIFVDDGGDYMFELTDREPAKSRRKIVEEVQADVPAWMMPPALSVTANTVGAIDSVRFTWSNDSNTSS